MILISRNSTSSKSETLTGPLYLKILKQAVTHEIVAQFYSRMELPALLQFLERYFEPRKVTEWPAKFPDLAPPDFLLSDYLLGWLLNGKFSLLFSA